MDKLTTEQLKAMAYDIVVQNAQNQQNLQAIQAELIRRAQAEMANKEVGVPPKGTGRAPKEA